MQTPKIFTFFSWCIDFQTPESYECNTPKYLLQKIKYPDPKYRNFSKSLAPKYSTSSPVKKKVVSTFPRNYTDLYISHDFVTFLYSSVSNCRPSHLPILISMSRKSLPTIIDMFLSYLTSPIFTDFSLNMYLYDLARITISFHHIHVS